MYLDERSSKLRLTEVKLKTPSTSYNITEAMTPLPLLLLLLMYKRAACCCLRLTLLVNAC